MPAELQVLNGELQWKRVRLSGPRCLIGRRDDCTVVLKDAWASREHTLIIESTPGEWMVQDLDSENGSYVNGVRVTESPLRHLDVLRVGRTEMRFTNMAERSDQEASEAPLRLTGGATPRNQTFSTATPEVEEGPRESHVPVGEQTVFDPAGRSRSDRPRSDLRERVRRLEKLLLEKEEENSRLASENAVFKRALAAGGFFDPETGRFEIERLSTPGPIPVIPDGLLRLVANPLARLTYPLVEGGHLDLSEVHGEPDGGIGLFRVGVIGLQRGCGARLAEAFHDIGYRRVVVVDFDRTGSSSTDRAPRIGLGAPREQVGVREIAEAELRLQAAFRTTLGTDLTLSLLAFGLGSRVGGGILGAVRDLLGDYEDLSRGAAPERSHIGALVTMPSAESLEDPTLLARARKGADQVRKLLAAGKLSPVILVDAGSLETLVPGDGEETRDERGQSLGSAVDLLQRLASIAPLAGDLDAAGALNLLLGGGISTLGLGATSQVDEESMSQAVRTALGEGLLFRGVPASRARTAIVVAQIGSEVPEGEAILVRRLESSVAKAREILPQASVATGIYRDDGPGVRVLGFVGGLPTPEFLV